MSPLLTPLQVGAMTLPNRIIMSPLTRCRSSDGRVPNALMADYYAQRAGAGLILSEATAVTPMGVGYPDTPGIWSEAQVEGWQRVTAAVHARGGRIFAQLWHVGRISHPDLLDGAQPVSASDIQAAGHVPLKRPKTPYGIPRPLRLEEIPGLIADYAQGAANALRAGFDGVELHAANAYLIEQFMGDKINKRSDAYGGSIANRCRLLNEVTDALIGVCGAGRVGIHLSPRMISNDGGDSDPPAVYRHAVAELARRKPAFLFIREYPGEDSMLGEIKRIFGGVVIGNDTFTVKAAEAALRSGDADAIAWGRAFIANPDLPERIRLGSPWNEPDTSTFYGAGTDGPAVGYTDYPALA
jgi:2,4-dienoyl-CoA reductase-like NADH-dependent reductase (Old Yellow Enzyme family)